MNREPRPIASQINSEQGTVTILNEFVSNPDGTYISTSCTAERITGWGSRDYLQRIAKQQESKETNSTI